MITLPRPNEPQNPVDLDGFSPMGAKIIGVVCIVCTSICYSSVAVITRLLPGLHYSVILFYYSVFAMVSVAVILLLETLIKWQALRIMSYDWLQVALMVASSIFNFLNL